jgi:hypothetical protein
MSGANFHWSIRAARSGPVGKGEISWSRARPAQQVTAPEGDGHHAPPRRGRERWVSGGPVLPARLDQFLSGRDTSAVTPARRRPGRRKEASSRAGSLGAPAAGGSSSLRSDPSSPARREQARRRPHPGGAMTVSTATAARRRPGTGKEDLGAASSRAGSLGAPGGPGSSSLRSDPSSPPPRERARRRPRTGGAMTVSTATAARRSPGTRKEDLGAASSRPGSLGAPGGPGSSSLRSDPSSPVPREQARRRPHPSGATNPSTVRPAHKSRRKGGSHSPASSRRTAYQPGISNAIHRLRGLVRELDLTGFGPRRSNRKPGRTRISSGLLAYPPVVGRPPPMRVFHNCTAIHKKKKKQKEKCYCCY